ncbi:hypothetical protein BDM02DRAFT_3152448 [Thelephora ganbajun]|uniref:Uncharacterized protein n=1 Tax=Thelephora ganbajun TaxID=370292 RepID=A0ACB6YY47_THEGA|nr:hypothetical protein BDM02DRAFT_3152448 [Thelephora ganbajun]
MPASSVPPVRHRLRSPSSSSNSDAPPPTRRRLFSKPLQPTLTSVPLPPRLTLSFKVNGDSTSNSVSILPPSFCPLSFKIGDDSTSNPEGVRSSRTQSVTDHPVPNFKTTTKHPQAGIYLSLPPAVPDVGDQEDNEGSPRAEEDVLQDYCQQALLLDGLQRIDAWTYVVQDWDETLGILEPARFYHVRSLPTSETSVSFVCDCPDCHHRGCIHIRLFKAHAHHILPLEPFSSTPHPPAFLVTHSVTLGSFIFSVCSTRGVGLQGGKRTIVSLSRNGWWSC